MPNLKHLLDELQELGVEPNKVRVPGQLYDDLVQRQVKRYHLPFYVCKS